MAVQVPDEVQAHRRHLTDLLPHRIRFLQSRVLVHVPVSGGRAERVNVDEEALGSRNVARGHSHHSHTTTTTSTTAKPHHRSRPRHHHHQQPQPPYHSCRLHHQHYQHQHANLQQQSQQHLQQQPPPPPPAPSGQHQSLPSHHHHHQRGATAEYRGRRAAIKNEDGSFWNSGKMSYHCPICNAGYTYKKTLKTHMKYDCGKEPRFKCPYCSKRDKCSSNIYKHIRMRHDGMPVIVHRN